VLTAPSREHKKQESLMADVFISYSKSDSSLATVVATGLEKAGYTVWWDTALISGETFRAAIDRELDQSRAVIVIWTPNSIASNWVIAEAEHAARQSKFVPVRVNDVEPYQIPKPYNLVHTPVFNDWDSVFKALTKNGVKPSQKTATARHALEAGAARTSATDKSSLEPHARQVPTVWPIVPIFLAGTSLPLTIGAMNTFDAVHLDLLGMVVPHNIKDGPMTSGTLCASALICSIALFNMVRWRSALSRVEVLLYWMASMLSLPIATGFLFYAFEWSLLGSGPISDHRETRQICSGVIIGAIAASLFPLYLATAIKTRITGAEFALFYTVFAIAGVVICSLLYLGFLHDGGYGGLIEPMSVSVVGALLGAYLLREWWLRKTR
jgi:hypothetical protein